jgi:hypothetical protein
MNNGDFMLFVVPCLQQLFARTIVTFEYAVVQRLSTHHRCGVVMRGFGYESSKLGISKCYIRFC